MSARDRDIARAALIGLPIWYVGWQILDALKVMIPDQNLVLRLAQGAVFGVIAGLACWLVLAVVYGVQEIVRSMRRRE